MTFLGGSAAQLWGLVQTWTGRANQAWGASRVWSSGASWETNYNDQVAASGSLTTQLANLQNSYNTLLGQYNALNASYNAMVADRNAWQANANAAYDGGSWGAGNLWSTDAHGDPGVWTNRYNAGVSAGQAAYQPAGLWSVAGGNGASWAVPYTGYYFLAVTANVTGGSNCGDAAGGLAIRVNGGDVAGANWNDWCTAGTYYGPVFFGAGTGVQSSVGAGRGFSSYNFSATFIPTPSYPH